MSGGATYVSYLQQIYEATEQIQSATAAEDWYTVLTGLTRRQELMSQVDALPDSARILTPEEGQRAAEILAGVSAMDMQATVAVESAMNDTRAQLQAGSQTRATVAAYERSGRGRNPVAEARFIDRNR